MNALATLPMEAVALRPATPADCEAVWRWNCAPDVRAWSRAGGDVSFLEHARWYARRLGDPARPMWIVEEHFTPVGVIRLDPVAGGFTRISIALGAGARGHGVGKAAIAAACRAWSRPIVAEILADNRASRACFEACGFHSVVACDGLLTYHWDPET
jgi:RimJ/RimL family protein N-acetyltransferase